MADAMITVDNVEIKCPSELSYGLEQVNSADAGRTQDAVMHVERIAKKVKLELSWSGLTWAETSAIMTAFDPEYISVKYPDMLSGTYQTKTFYTGDKSAPVRQWFDNNGKKIIDKLSFNIIEV